MEAAFENALRTLAASYEAAVAQRGGKSLARVATIVVNNGSFFNRLRDGKQFYVTNLERFAMWFRCPANWPDGFIPHEAIAALSSMGRAPDVFVPHPCSSSTAAVASDQSTFSHRGDA